MLTVVEHEQELAVGEVVGELLLCGPRRLVRHPDRGRHGLRHLGAGAQW
jgi:hypothetical protein